MYTCACIVVAVCTNWRAHKCVCDCVCACVWEGEKKWACEWERQWYVLVQCVCRAIDYECVRFGKERQSQCREVDTSCGWRKSVTSEDKLWRPFCGQPPSHGINRHRVEGRHRRRRRQWSRNQCLTSTQTTLVRPLHRVRRDRRVL